MYGVIHDLVNDPSDERRRERFLRHYERSEVTQGSATPGSVAPTGLLHSARNEGGAETTDCPPYPHPFTIASSAAQRCCAA